MRTKGTMRVKWMYLKYGARRESLTSVARPCAMKAKTINMVSV